jgi:hypothetical protein
MYVCIYMISIHMTHTHTHTHIYILSEVVFWVVTYARQKRDGTHAHVSKHLHTSAYVSIRQHTSANVSIRQHTSATGHTRMSARESSYEPARLPKRSLSTSLTLKVLQRLFFFSCLRGADTRELEQMGRSYGACC